MVVVIPCTLPPHIDTTQYSGSNLGRLQESLIVMQGTYAQLPGCLFCKGGTFDHIPSHCDMTVSLLLAPLGTATANTIGAAVTSANGQTTTCCRLLEAVLWKARVRYANETGRLLVPQASADACIQVQIHPAFAFVPARYVL